MRKSNKMKQIAIALLITMFLPSTLLIAQKGDENDKYYEMEKILPVARLLYVEHICGLPNEIRIADIL